MTDYFNNRLQLLQVRYEQVIGRRNEVAEQGNGIFERYQDPILTREHIPLSWKYDLNVLSNPYLMERFGINAVFNAGAIKWRNRYILVARVEGCDRKSFFAVAESEDGINHFRFWDRPIVLPGTGKPETNVYDMRLVAHEDGWIYALFCTERGSDEPSARGEIIAIAQCGIARTRDLSTWERLPDLRTPSPQQRNVVLHPEFVKGKYAFYTRPQDDFIHPGRGGGIGFGLSDSMTAPEVKEEKIIDHRVYHTVYELKNGLGPAPLKTKLGWLHLAHGVRNTAAGLRYVCYLFLTDLKDITRVTHKPGGYFLAPEGDERVGDVSNVLFCNGWIAGEDGQVYIYYASSDTRMHVATTDIARLLDYVINTPSDGLRSSTSVDAINKIILRNELIVKESGKV